MTTKAFVAKVNKIHNRKGKDYYVFRINIPNTIAKELQLEKDDRLMVQARKAEWHELLDWSEMKHTFEKLPRNLQMKIKEQVGESSPQMKTSITETFARKMFSTEGSKFDDMHAHQRIIPRTKHNQK